MRYFMAAVLLVMTVVLACLSVLFGQGGDWTGCVGFGILALFFAAGMWMMLNEKED